MSRGSFSASRFSERSIDIPRMIAIFANSDGWIVKPAGSAIHACAPLISVPIGESTTTSPMTETTHRIGVYARSSR